MKNIIQTQMIPEDFTGDIFDENTCPGSKSFRRALKKNMNWFQRLFIDTAWRVNTNGDIKWRSKDERGQLKDMMRSRVGDFVVFERVKNKK